MAVPVGLVSPVAPGFIAYVALAFFQNEHGYARKFGCAQLDSQRQAAQTATQNYYIPELTHKFLIISVPLESHESLPDAKGHGSIHRAPQALRGWK